MGQEVKNLLRAQSKYGLMGSSANRKLFFRGSQEHFLHKSDIWDRTPPYTSNAVYMFVEGFKGPKSLNRIQLSWFFKSYGIFSDFVVPMWSPWSPHHPHHPHTIPVIPTSSPHHPCHHPHCSHSLQKVPMWSPWLWSRGLHSILSP